MELKWAVGEVERLWLQDRGLRSCSSGVDAYPVSDTGAYGGGPSLALGFSLQGPGSRCHHHLSSRRARLWS